MYRVIIEMDRVAEAETIVQACQIFIQKIKDKLKNGGMSAQILYETCLIEGDVNGQKAVMNFFAISDFAHAIGILKEDGSLSTKPLPFVHKDIAEAILVAAHNNSFAAYMVEHADLLERIHEDSENQPQENNSGDVIITP